MPQFYPQHPWTPFSGPPPAQEACHMRPAPKSSLVPGPPMGAQFLPGINMSDPQSVYDFMSALQWWQSMGGSFPPAPPGERCIAFLTNLLTFLVFSTSYFKKNTLRECEHPLSPLLPSMVFLYLSIFQRWHLRWNNRAKVQKST